LTLVTACAATARQPVATADPLSDFTRRVAVYMALHDSLQAQGRSPEQTADAGANRASQQELGAHLRAARRDARQGDILTPAIAAVLRAAMNPELRGMAAADTRASIRDDAPIVFALRVNAAYPDGAARATVPPNVLKSLPRLPQDLEYRIVGSHLVLLDVDAALVVDYMLNVMCARC
jgi:hypothetical protein